MILVCVLLSGVVAHLWTPPRGSQPHAHGCLRRLRMGLERVGEAVRGRFTFITPHGDEAFIVGRGLMSVAARLQAGQSPPRAWSDVAATLPTGLRRGFKQLNTTNPGEGGLSPALDAAHAATGLAHELGAPMAPVLDSCAHGIEEATRAQAERDTALAAPQTTARILFLLPFLG